MEKEQVEELKRKFGKKSLSIRVQESDLYDWNPAAAGLLLVITLGTRRRDEAWVQEDCPWTAEEMVGWCDMAQWRLALRSKMSESQVQRYIEQFEEDGVIEVEGWTDSNQAEHNRYRIIEAVVDEHQRPEQKRHVKRPSRYKKKRGANKGSFSATNQPGKKSLAGVAGDKE